MEQSAPDASPRPSSEPTKEKPEKIQITGRVTLPPLVRSADAVKQAYARFALAEHPDAGETVYHQVYATKRYAEKIAELNLQVGEEVKVTGARHQQPKWDELHRPVVDQDGQVITEQTFYAYHVKRVPPQTNSVRSSFAPESTNEK